MTPAEFQTTSLAWLSAGTAVVGGLAMFLVYVLGKIKEVEAAAQKRSADNAARLDQHDAIQGVVTSPTSPVGIAWSPLDAAGKPIVANSPVPLRPAGTLAPLPSHERAWPSSEPPPSV